MLLFSFISFIICNNEYIKSQSFGFI
jgi:hypothetical protein